MTSSSGTESGPGNGVDRSKAKAKSKRAGTRDALEIWGLAIVIAALGTWLTLRYVDAAPPRRVVLATGPEGGAYHEIARAIRAEVDADALEIELRPTAGSVENRALLAKGEADLAIVQGGILDAKRDAALESIGGLAIEAVWLFTHDKLERLDALRGKRIAIGQDGSGTRPVAVELLRLAGLSAQDYSAVDAAPKAAVEAMLAGRGECDAVFLVSNARASGVDRLMRSAPGVQLAALERAHAFTRHAQYLREVELSPGMFDIEADLPRARVPLLATTASLVTRHGFHDSLPPLLLDAAQRALRRGGIFEDAGKFPTAQGLDTPLADSAHRWFQSGRSWLYRVLPFRLAALVDRLKILLLPLLTLLLPLVRFAPPVYRWRVRRRIFRWYAVVLDLEGDLREDASVENVEHALERLSKLQREITGIRVPLSYAEELYNLRMHLRQVREDLYRRRSELRTAA